MLKNIFFTFLVLFIVGCGYKPSSYYTKQEIYGKVYVQTKIDVKNTTNSVLIKDAINSMIVNQFNAKIVNNIKDANTLVDASLTSVKTTTLQTQDGYGKLYKTTVTIKVNYKDLKTSKSKSITVTGTYNYSIDEDSVITQAKRDESIKIASQKALSNIISKIAINSIDTQ
jgi:hypothetical protein